jgi:hypothetical protein
MEMYRTLGLMEEEDSLTFDELPGNYGPPWGSISIARHFPMG